MAKTAFHNRLRELLHQEPFRPFVVEYRDGRRLVINRPPVVFADGVASFIDPKDGALVDFSHDEVKAMVVLQEEASV
jgi:hypothetical protein